VNPKWPVRRLGDLCELVGGGTPAKDRSDFYGGGIPWATVRDMNVDLLTSTEHNLTEAGLKFSSSHVVPAGSVVIATRVGLGKVVMLAQDTAINQDLRGLVIRDPGIVTDRFIYLWYRSIASQVIAAGTGATVQGVTLPFVSSLEVPVPPLAEQQRIVGKLDELSEIHAELATCYASAVEQTKAIWVSTLNHELEPKDSWTPVTLGDVATFHNGRAYKKEELLASGKYRVLRVGNFFSSDSWYWSDLELDPTKYCVHGDLLYAWSASFGPRIWDGDKTIYHYHIWKVVEDSSLIGRMFLKFWLEADVERVKAASGTGTTMMHVSKGSIEAREIRVPPLSLQRAIVEKLEEVQKGLSLLVDVHSKRLEAAQNLRRSVLAAAFRGDL